MLFMEGELMEAILRNENTGEPDIRKRIRPVRRGARGKGLYQQHLACSLPDCLACETCNTAKGSKDIAVFLKKKPDLLKRIQAQAKVPLKDAAAVNATRWALLERLKATGLPVECGTGGLTKFHRANRKLPKTHWLDAVCVGKSTPDTLVMKGIRPLLIKATGHGRRQMCVTDKYGFPKQHKERKGSYLGYRTGDMVKAITPKGTFQGRIAIRYRPSFHLGKEDIHPKYMRHVHRADGYEYRQERSA